MQNFPGIPGLPWLAAVSTTVGDADGAQRLAQALLAAQLVACVQVEPIASHYRWQGALQAEDEWRLLCKTLPAAVPALLAWLQAEHPYSLPQLVVQPLQASVAYADWVRAAVALP